MSRSLSQEGDLATISAPIDVLGVNYYFSQKFTGFDEDGRTVDDDGQPISRTLPLDKPRTAMDWEIVPEGFTDLLVRISRDYPGLPMVITENGSAFDDVPDEYGYVADDDRTAYFPPTWRPSPRRSSRAPTSAATWPGPCWTTSNGPTATTSASASSGSTTKPRPAPPSRAPST